MDKFTRNQIYVWAYEKIKSNPKVYGGDKSNPIIMKAYVQEFHNGERADQLSDIVYSVLSTVSRVKNKLLKKNPQFDYRKINKSKKKKTSNNRSATKKQLLEGENV